MQRETGASAASRGRRLRAPVAPGCSANQNIKIKAKMSLLQSLQPPEECRGMTVIDRLKFSMKFKVASVIIPAKMTGAVRKALASVLIKLPKIASVVACDGNKDKRKILLDPKLSLVDGKLQGISDDLIEYLESNEAFKFDHHEIELGYDYWSTEEVLRAILPKDIEIITAFETIGHIARLNLPDTLMPYKHIIGTVILDKNPALATVATKTGNIETKFRTFPMEVLAGEDNFLTEVKENNCRFKLDFSKVYWNSRLTTEHTRIVNFLKPTDTVVDVFAGIGPFAVPAAKMGCKMVHCNDLNPESFHWLNENIRINKLRRDCIKSFNLDGRDFMRKMLSEKVDMDCMLMNLPAMAIEFLDVLSEFPEYHKTFTIHCHCFSKEENFMEDIVQRAETVVGTSLTDADVLFVRSVAPNKDMYCISFTWPSQSPNSKKIKLDETLNR